MRPIMPNCITCKYFAPVVTIGAKPACKAFPKRIPKIIWLQGNPHTEPVEGDNGIRFKKI